MNSTRTSNGMLIELVMEIFPTKFHEPDAYICNMHTSRHLNRYRYDDDNN